MKLPALLVLLLALQICAPASQVRKNKQKPEAAPSTPAPAKSAPAKTATADATARTVVCVDPGHPSEVASGKNVQNGTSEAHVDWAVASKLRDLLEARGYTVVLTKGAEDELVRNKDRALVANRSRAALMIRLHCDASQERGYAVYYPDRQGRSKDGTTGPSRDVIEESRRAAEAVHSALAEDLAGALNDNGVRTDNQTKVGREQGGALTGSIFSDVAVVTVEMVGRAQQSGGSVNESADGQPRLAGDSP